MQPGTFVKMSDALKDKLRRAGMHKHVDEFDGCVGVVQGLTDYHKQGDLHDPAKLGPEVDVRWTPSNLRYAYLPEELVAVFDIWQEFMRLARLALEGKSEDVRMLLARDLRYVVRQSPAHAAKAVELIKKHTLGGITVRSNDSEGIG